MKTLELFEGTIDGEQAYMSNEDLERKFHGAKHASEQLSYLFNDIYEKNKQLSGPDTMVVALTSDEVRLYKQKGYYSLNSREKHIMFNHYMDAIIPVVRRMNDLSDRIYALEATMRLCSNRLDRRGHKVRSSY